MGVRRRRPDDEADCGADGGRDGVIHDSDAGRDSGDLCDLEREIVEQ